jgi:YHS domain-containing protein
VTVGPTIDTESGKDIPNTCETKFDAISGFRGETFVFKGKYFWRLNPNKVLERTTASEVKNFWLDLPAHFDKIDAVYERPKDSKIVFFIGRQYWVFSSHKPDAGYPKPLTDLGLGKHIERIDAAMVWGHNGKTYLFSGNKYWRLEESEGKVELDYPRDMDIWNGVPYDIDAAFQWHQDGKTYFFKDDNYWEFDNRKMTVTPDSPQKATTFWFDSVCKTPQISSNDGVVSSTQSITMFNKYTICKLLLVLLFLTSRQSLG